ncbi:MAG: adenylosuccinate synthase [Acidobacteriota bacterium]|nr:adenylosuccinate synthase [Acidobacteriota bacterium]
MPNLAIIGGQWGDEGKGKVVDLLAPRFDIVARFQGGPNAGHTVVFDGQTFALHHVPSGIFHDGVLSVIGNGLLVDPERLIREIDELTSRGVPVAERLRISLAAHVILPLHRELDEAIEARWGTGAIGTTKRGIGPAAGAKAQRFGVRVADLGRPDGIRSAISRLLASGFDGWMRELGVAPPDPDEVAGQAASWWSSLAPMCAGTTALMHDALDDGRSILFEGAQGTLLDLEQGTYPFVTSSNTTTAGIAVGLGVPPRAVSTSIGVFKAYVTRVGGGPFPTEIEGAEGERLREAGSEYGTTTGRPRRCGWFDAVAARHAVRLNGLDGLAVTKFDILTGLDLVRICVAYELDGRRLDRVPEAARDYDRLVPVYEDLPGWSEPIGDARSVHELPAAARRVLDRIAVLCGCPVALVSVGPDRRASLFPEGVLKIGAIPDARPGSAP